MSHAAAESPVVAPALEVPRERLPRHIAIIMDGNGRWAERRGLSRLLGHRAGAKTVRQVIGEASQLGIKAMTLYSFSSENWKRPPDEVNALMELCCEHLLSEREEMVERNIRFRAIGRLAGLPTPVRDHIAKAEQATAECTGLTMVLALNYGSRAEIVDATRSIATLVAEGRLTPEQIDETLFADHLYTFGLPDPDLLIRTAGERRVSNYLLWQISYAEIHVTDVLWPDFGVSDLHRAIRDYASRDRRFGGLARG
ncbi:MAG: isoprenyl transferase [Phycisphaerales bacterium]|nr:isoprenyl transferase [Phycisphaerales bacterium]